MELRRWVIRIGLAAATLLVVGRLASVWLLESAWFSAMGLSALYQDMLVDRALLQGPAWALGTLFAWVNLRAVRQTIRAVAIPARVANLEMTAMLPARRLDLIIVALAILMGACLAWPLNDWTQVDRLRYGVPFKEIEGILGRDLGFYVYQLPLEETAYLWALSTVLVVALVVFVLYAMTRSLRLSGRKVVTTTHARRHFSVIGALLLLLLAWSFRLDAFDLLRSGSGHDGLFTRADHVVALPMDRVLVALCMVAAPICLQAGWRGNVRVAFAMVTGLLIAAVGGRQLVPQLVARSGWLGPASTDQRAYETTRALHSRRAFNADGLRRPIDHVDVEGRTRTPGLTRGELGQWVSLWELPAITNAGPRTEGPAAAAFTGTSRTADGHIAALTLRHRDGERDSERGSERDSERDAGWMLTQTDLTQAEQTEHTLPWPALERSGAGDTHELMVGPGLRGHRVRTEGTGDLGGSLTALWRRVAFAWALRDAALLTLDPEQQRTARVITVRDVRERVERVAPGFAQSETVVPVFHDGVLTWVIHLYSASDRYPLSQHLLLAGAERSYFRLAATAFVDASTGRIKLLPVARPDPIARSWFPRLAPLLVRPDDLSVALRQQIPPATDGALAQVVTIVQYGTRLASVRGRQLLEGTLAGGAPPPHLTATALGPVPAWSLPLLDGDGQLAGLLTAVGGPDRVTVWDSTASPRSRWQSLADDLRTAALRASATTGSPASGIGLSPDSVPAPSGQLTPVRVVPGEHGPVLWQGVVGPRRDDGAMIRAVAVADSGRIRTGATLTTALSDDHPTANGQGGGTRPTRTDGASPITTSVTRWYDTMRAALQRGEWGRFGAAFDSLGRALGRPTGVAPPSRP